MLWSDQAVMPSRRHRPDLPDADYCDCQREVTDPKPPQSRADSSAEAPMSVAEAEDEATQAEARAEAARARAIRLRQEAESGSSDDREVTEPAGAAEKDGVPGPSRLSRRPGRKAVAVGAATLLGCASLGVSGYLVWQRHTIVHNRQLAGEFAAAARQGVTTFMSIDPDHAKEDVQRIIDNSTGQLKDQISATSSHMVEQAQSSKVKSKGTVEAVAVESVTNNSAVVLVAAKSDVTNGDNTKRPPAVWRLSVNIARDGGQLKMSKLEFLQ